MKPRSNQRMAQVDTAVIPEVNRMITDTPGTISLGQGVVFYPPPPQALHYATQRINESNKQHIYGRVAGLEELHQLIADKLATHNNIHMDNRQTVFVTAGANMAFNALILSICDPADEVILLLPYYFNHEMTIKMCGCIARCINTDNLCQPLINQIAQAINNKTKAIVTVSPNNPTGTVYSKETLTEINRLCRDNNIYHISDEAYEDFVFGDHSHFSPASIEGSSEHTLSLFSLSKSYGFASWRIGYMLVPQALSSALTKVQDNILICPSNISQYAAMECIRQSRDYIDPFLKQIDANRQLCIQSLKPLVSSRLIGEFTAQGAIYLWLKLNCTMDDREIVEFLIREHKVAVLPGSAFGEKDDIALRVSYAALPTEVLQKGIERLIEGIRAIPN